MAQARSEAAERYLDLACLTYDSGAALDDPARRRAATERLLESPELASTDVFVAASIGDLDAVREQLAVDPGLVTATRPNGWTALMCLTYARVPQDDAYGTARLLLDAGADPNAGVLHGGHVPPFTALTGCFGEGENGPFRQSRHPLGEDLAGLLLDHGADPNDGQTLYNRMFSRDDAHLRLLLAHGLGRGDGGPWRERLGGRQESPHRMVAMQVDWAVAHGFDDRLALLASYGLGDSSTGPGSDRSPASPWKPRPGRPPVQAHATPDGVRAVAAAGEDVDARDDGRTLLHHAAWIGDVDLVEALLSVGADPDAVDDEYGTTPLGWAEWSYAGATADVLRPVTGRR